MSEGADMLKRYRARRDARIREIVRQAFAERDKVTIAALLEQAKLTAETSAKVVDALDRMPRSLTMQVGPGNIARLVNTGTQQNAQR